MIPLITLIQTLRKRKTEEEMLALFTSLAQCIMQMVNGEPVKPIPGLEADKDGIPNLLNPWKKASKKAGLKKLIIAIWQTLILLTPTSPDVVAQSTNVAKLVARFPSLIKENEEKKKRLRINQSSSSVQKEKIGKNKTPSTKKKVNSNTSQFKGKISPKYSINFQ